MKIRKNDTVKVTRGKDKGKTGKVEKVFPKKNKVTVAGVNVYKKHLKPKGKDKPGGIIDIIKPLAVANVVLVCPKCKKQTRVGYQFDKTSLPAGRQTKKYRICKKCGQEI